MCVAFGLDLSLVGFPTDDLEALIRETIADTNIGKGGDLLKGLHENGRITLIPASTKRPPQASDWPGIPVATSSHPDPSKQVPLSDLGRLLRITKGREGDPGQRLCLIMGLGKKGLPPTLMNSVPYHLELTGKNVPLETATVMGVISERLRNLR